MRFVVALAFALTASVAHAAVFEFTAEQTVYACPPGAHHPIIECQVATKNKVPGRIELAALTDGLLFGKWASQTSPVPAFFQIYASHYTNMHIGTVLALNISAGLEADANLNSYVFTEIDPQHLPPGGILFGSARKTIGDVEFVPSLVLSDLKYTE